MAKIYLPDIFNLRPQFLQMVQSHKGGVLVLMKETLGTTLPPTTTKGQGLIDRWTDHVIRKLEVSVLPPDFWGRQRGWRLNRLLLGQSGYVM